MKITYVVTECRDKISLRCTKTFNRKVQRGRPQLNCEACKAVKAPVKPRATKTVVSQVTNSEVIVKKGNCPCGNVFDINSGRGRKPSKCNDCRSAGIVYRADNDGEMQAIRAETLAEEQRELREQAGRERAERLTLLMKPLIDKDERRRKLALSA